MRVSEVLNLDRDEVDLTGGVLTVRACKFGKSRHLPVHESTTQALSHYARRRYRLCPHPLTPAFFLAERGTPITHWALRWTFAKLWKQVGLRAPSKSHGIGPRLRDMRHRFAMNTPLRWYRDGVDVERHIPRLATWLGHAHVSDTYWYLTATEDSNPAENVDGAACGASSASQTGSKLIRSRVPVARATFSSVRVDG